MNILNKIIHQSIILCLGILIYSCNYNEPKQIEEYSIPADTDVSKIDIDSEISHIIKDYLSFVDTGKTYVLCNDSLYATTLLHHFYKKNNYKNIWLKGNYDNPLLDSLVHLLSLSWSYGLYMEDYHYHTIDSLLRRIKSSTEYNIDIAGMAKAELLLSDAVFTMAIDVNKGRLHKDSLTREWKGANEDTLLVNELYIALEKRNLKAFIDSLEPKNIEYKALKIALHNFYTEFKYSNWDSLHYQSDDTNSFEERLIKRLKASHDYFEEYSGNKQQKLITAIKNFQCKHNLSEDGKIGKLTYKALQKSKLDYIHLFEVNMERWRLYRKPQDKRYVWINIPLFKMKVFEDDLLVFTSSVIVGEPEHPTPQLHSNIRYFLIYPYWNVPHKIAVEEMLPILKNNPGYLLHNNFEVINRRGDIVTVPVNWKKYTEDYFPFKLRQRMGDDNALGILKFYFNNKYGVYLHDTNNKNLFGSDNRALSHGCIRLEKYIDFAMYLIRSDSMKYSENDFKYDILQEKQKYVYLKKVLPIYTAYFTIDFTYGNKEPIYLNDIYNYDTKMVNSIYFYPNNK